MLSSPYSTGSLDTSSFDAAPLTLQILVVDDDALFRELVSKQLDIFGYRATTVPCAREALAELQAKSFHLLITDWRMHEIDGCQLVREVRRRGMTLPIIICSGWLDQEGLPDDVALELAATLQKPAPVHEMMLAITNAI
jgi:DNA-binding NtrC family response regulator